MSLTRSQRIHRGFHRTGTVVALIFVVLGGLITLGGGGLFAPIIGLVLAAIAYVLSRAVGWIIAGFAGE